MTLPNSARSKDSASEWSAGDGVSPSVMVGFSRFFPAAIISRWICATLSLASTAWTLSVHSSTWLTRRRSATVSGIVTPMSSDDDSRSRTVNQQNVGLMKTSQLLTANRDWEPAFNYKTRNTLHCDQANVYSPHAIFSSISPDLPFHNFSLYRRSASDPLLLNKCPISHHMCQQLL